MRRTLSMNAHLRKLSAAPDISHRPVRRCFWPAWVRTTADHPQQGERIISYEPEGMVAPHLGTFSASLTEHGGALLRDIPSVRHRKRYTDERMHTCAARIRHFAR